MTFEELTALGELHVQLKNERERNRVLSREIDSIAENEVWLVVQPNGLDLPHLKIDLCVSARAIAQCRSLGEASNLAYSIFCQAQKLLERAIIGGGD